MTEMNALTTAGASALLPTNMESAIRLAEMMARGKVGIPQHLRDNPGDCLAVVEQSMRWHMSPFAVAQCTSVIQGKLMFEGKLVSAALHSSGLLASRLDYEFSGSGDGRTIIVRGLIKGEEKPREISVALKDARTSNSMWQKQPDQQLVYFATRAWARRHASEVMLGVYSPEDFDTSTPFSGTTIEGERVLSGQPRETGFIIGDELPPSATDAKPVQQQPKKRTWTELLDKIEQDFAAAQTRDEVDAVLASEEVQKAMDTARNGARDRLTGIVQAAMRRTDDGWPGPRPEDFQREHEAAA